MQFLLARPRPAERTSAISCITKEPRLSHDPTQSVPTPQVTQCSTWYADFTSRHLNCSRIRNVSTGATDIALLVVFSPRDCIDRSALPEASSMSSGDVPTPLFATR